MRADGLDITLISGQQQFRLHFDGEEEVQAAFAKFQWGSGLYGLRDVL